MIGSYIVTCIRQEFRVKPTGFDEKTGWTWLVECVEDNTAAAWNGGPDYQGPQPRDVTAWSPVEAMLNYGYRPGSIWQIHEESKDESD